jgi:hypothetical protein
MMRGTNNKGTMIRAWQQGHNNEGTTMSHNEGTTTSHNEGTMRDPPHTYKHLLIGGLIIVVKYSI